mmetsp:Transcript_7518/g.20319  ORF Transcript_7518/g.20319 Transcript_7518/m.20319 type:complete len:90 (+) Transcript_7518:22-291(+)
MLTKLSTLCLRGHSWLTPATRARQLRVCDSDVDGEDRKECCRGNDGQTGHCSLVEMGAGNNFDAGLTILMIQMRCRVGEIAISGWMRLP